MTGQATIESAIEYHTMIPDMLGTAATVIGILSALVMALASWLKQGMTLKQLKEQLTEMHGATRERLHGIAEKHDACKSHQDSRWEIRRTELLNQEREFMKAIGSLSAKVVALGQKLDDFIAWTKNGGPNK